jgi:hypothetical protein
MRRTCLSVRNLRYLVLLIGLFALLGPVSSAQSIVDFNQLLINNGGDAKAAADVLAEALIGDGGGIHLIPGSSVFSGSTHSVGILSGGSAITGNSGFDNWVAIGTGDLDGGVCQEWEGSQDPLPMANGILGGGGARFQHVFPDDDRVRSDYRVH